MADEADKVRIHPPYPHHPRFRIQSLPQLLKQRLADVGVAHRKLWQVQVDAFMLASEFELLLNLAELFADPQTCFVGWVGSDKEHAEFVAQAGCGCRGRLRGVSVAGACFGVMGLPHCNADNCQRKGKAGRACPGKDSSIPIREGILSIRHECGTSSRSRCTTPSSMGDYTFNSFRTYVN